MLSRLVLGCGAVGQRIVKSAAESNGTLRVITRNGDRVETIRDENVRAERADPTDPTVLREAGPADVVFVAEAVPDRSVRIARTARSVFPDATLVVYASLDATGDDVSALSEFADRVVEARRTIAGSIADLVSNQGLQVSRLRRAVSAVEGTLAIVMHDNPDPDAIGSAIALAQIASDVGVEAVPCYYGRINHQENRALVNLLDLDLRRLSPDADLSDFVGFALVDHSRPGVNDQLPPDLAVDVVIDHHPPRGPIDAQFVDLRSEVGATSTLLTEYLERFGIDDYGGQRVATALLYGIRVDTNDFDRDVSTDDFEAAAALLPHVDADVLDRIESPAVSTDTFDTFGRAIANREIRGLTLVSCVGAVNDRDALAQAADRLLDLEGISTTLVYGYDEDGSDDLLGLDAADAETGGTIYASARSRGTSLDLGETLRIAFDDLGSAGGHANMAGAQIPVSRLGRDVLGLDPSARIEAIREEISNTFFEAVEERPREVYDVDFDSGIQIGEFDVRSIGDVDGD